jgi:spore coat polysaccharide biosynthesis protein SpsF
MTGIVLQVRLDSSRLPGKALLPLGRAGARKKDPLTARVMEALNLVPAEIRILATDEASAPKLGPLAEACRFELFVGPKEDVLARFCQAARKYSLDRVVRATGDNPLVSYELASLLLEYHAASGADCSGYVGMPVGMGVEIVEAEALFAAERESLEPYDREHVTPFVRSRPERFKVECPPAPEEYQLPMGRVTIDTASDYERVQAIFAELWRGSPLPAAEVLAWLRARAE